jgi:hypothetical protein
MRVRVDREADAVYVNLTDRAICDRERVALQHRDLPKEIRQRPRSQQPTHAPAYYDRMVTDPFHDAPCRRRQRPFAGYRWYGTAIEPVLPGPARGNHKSVSGV